MPDYGVDLTLRRVIWRRNHFEECGLALNLQLKSTTKPVLTTNDTISFDLDVVTYNRLRIAPRASPALLVLFVMPSDQAEWIDHNEVRLEIRHCAYWMSLRRESPSQNVSTIRVQIPRQNQFTPKQLERIMEVIQRREDL
jgi:Domain of unknown function (DUF4365)